MRMKSTDLVQNWYGTNGNYSLYTSDYLKLNIDVIYSIVEQEDTSRPFLSSSPVNGIETQTEGWVAKDPGDMHYDDIHEYLYLVPFYDLSQYRIPRFSSEYGLQSYPSYAVQVYNESDMDYLGELNEYRNHPPFGNIQMMTEATMYFHLPNTTDKKQQFKDLIYLTQIDKAIGMQTEREHLRRWQNQLDSEGQGNTMGALYWMLADIWQAPTWASLEYGGKWKMLHFFAKHFFAPTLLSPFINGDELDIYLVLDEVPVKETRHHSTYNIHFQPKSNPRPFNVFDLNTYGNQQQEAISTNQIVTDSHVTTSSEFAGSLYIELYTWSSLTALKTWKVPFEINSTAQSIFRHNVDAMLRELGGLDRKRCFVYMHMGDRVNGPTNWLSLSTFKEAVGLIKPSLQIKEVNATVKPDEFVILLETNAVSPFVWLEAYVIKGRFSDNGFLLMTSQRTLTFYAWEPVDTKRIQASLTVKSLMDVYH